MPEAAHSVDPLPLNVRREHGTNRVLQELHRLMVNIDAALEQQILDIPQAKRRADIRHHYQSNDLGL